MYTTAHGKDRIRDRVGVPLKSVDRVAQTAFDRGVTHAETAGSLNRYLSGIYLNKHRGNNLRIWGEKVYIFENDALITVLNLPNKYKRVVREIMRKRDKEETSWR
jgi:hypothetical protein